MWAPNNGCGSSRPMAFTSWACRQLPLKLCPGRLAVVFLLVVEVPNKWVRWLTPHGLHAWVSWGRRSLGSSTYRSDSPGGSSICRSDSLSHYLDFVDLSFGLPRGFVDLSFGLPVIFSIIFLSISHDPPHSQPCRALRSLSRPFKCFTGLISPLLAL